MDRGTHKSGTIVDVSTGGVGRRRVPTRSPGAGPVARELGGGLLGTGVAAAALALFSAMVRQVPPPSGAARPDDVLLLLLAWLGLLLAAWLGVGSLLALATLLPGAAGRTAAGIAARVTPVAVRKALALALGASVGSMALPPALVSVAGSGPVTPSAGRASVLGGQTRAGDLAPGFTPTERMPGFVPTNEPAHDEGGPASVAGVTGRLGPGYAPTPTTPARATSDRRVTTATPRPADPGFVPTAPPTVHDADSPRLLAPAPRTTAAAHDLVAVRRGDSLWSIAARHLGPGATDSEIAWEWPRWYAANRHVIGDDPDLLVPGELLRPPSEPGTPAAPGAPAEQGAR